MPTKAELEAQLQDADNAIADAIHALNDDDLSETERAGEAEAILASIYEEEE